jgi:hypothetical protein
MKFILMLLCRVKREFYLKTIMTRDFKLLE